MAYYPYYTTYGDTDEIERMQHVQMRMAEARERADGIEHKTGIRPMGFFEFDRKNPTEREQSRSAKWALGVLGALMGGLFGSIHDESRFAEKAGVKNTLIGAAVVGVGGFLIGLAVKESRAQHMQRALEKYEIYLEATETHALVSPAGTALTFPSPKQHTEALLMERAEAQKAPQVFGV